MRGRFVTAMACVLMLASTVSAQVRSTGVVVGAVKDPSGAMIPGAAVRLTNAGTGATLTAESSAEGDFSFPVVPVGKYNLTAGKTGFKTAVVSGILVNAVENVRLDVTLELGLVSENINVTAAPAAINSVTADVGATVTSDQMNQLPLETRVFTQLVYLEPGVAIADPKAAGFASNTQANFSLNGVRSDENNVMMDGIRNLDTFGGEGFVTPNLYAMSEFRVENNSYSASTGRNGGAQVNIISRSGTNAFHGNAFEFLRNDATDARNFFANQIPEDRYNDFGYDVGGPIKKDRVFFFWSEEWRRIIESTGTRLAVVPTAAERNGDFSALLQQPNPQVINDPSTGLPFSNNVIPPSKIDPNATLLLSTYWPLPTPGFSEGGFNFTASDPDGVRWREESIRLDWKMTDKWSAFARFTQDNDTLLSPFGLFNPDVLPTVAASVQNYPFYNYVASATFVPRPNWVTEFRWGLYYGTDKRLDQTAASCRCRAPGLNIPEIFPGVHNDQNRIPTIEFGQGYAGVIFDWPFHDLAFTQPFEVNTTWVRSRHTVKFGGELTLDGKTEFTDYGINETNGLFNFTGQYTGNAIADLLVGKAYSYQETATNPYIPYRWDSFEPYIEDQVKLRPNLTLTAGLRYYYYQPEYAKDDRVNAFNPALFDPTKAATVNPDGTIVPGTQNFSNGLVFPRKNSPYGKFVYNPDYNGLAPRLGVVWDPTSTGKMALRAGYGIFYDRWGSWTDFSGQNPPFDQIATVFNTTLSNPAGATSKPIFPPALYTTLTPWVLPQVQKWSAGVERQVWGDTTLEAAYVGTKGTHLLGQLNLNQIRPSVAVAEGTISPDALRPYLGFSSITSFTTDSNSTYHALQVSAIRRMQHGLAFQASYTWSKTLTDSSSQWNAVQDSRNLKAEKGLAAFDSPQILTFNYLWEIPFFHHQTGPARAILDGWEVGGITDFRAGFPETVTLSFDNQGTGGGLERPNRVGNVAGPRTLTDFFNTAAFVVPPVATFGNSPNSVIRGPGLNNWDVALYKNIPIREKVRASFRAEAFNAVNHSQFTYVDSGFGDSTFGQVTSAYYPRVLQFGVDFTF